MNKIFSRVIFVLMIALLVLLVCLKIFLILNNNAPIAEGKFCSEKYHYGVFYADIGTERVFFKMEKEEYTRECPK